MLQGVVFRKQRIIFFFVLLSVWLDLAIVRNWLCVYSVDPHNIVDHFIQFGNISGGAKSRYSLMHLVWFIWKERNGKIFCGKENYPLQLLKKVKLLSFWWFKADSLAFHYSFHNWCQNPFLCAGIG